MAERIQPGDVPTHDLSRQIESGMQTFPGDPPVRATPHATMAEDGYRVTALELGSHAGTHVDAPSHTEPDGRTLGEFPPETFAFAARRVDLRGLEPRSAIGADDLPDSPVGEVTDADRTDADRTDANGADLLVLHTGWNEHWGTPVALDHPYLAPEAAERCAAAGWHVATDALNVDPTPSENASADEPTGFPAHGAILGAGNLIVENLTGLDDLPERFELRAYPLALDADGAPTRAVGVVENQNR